MCQSRIAWEQPHTNLGTQILQIDLRDISWETFFERTDKRSRHFPLCHHSINHNYNKILKSDWLSTALISALIGQFNRTVRVMPK